MASNAYLSLFTSGLAVNRPTTPELPGLSTYYETDTGVVNLWTGAAWVVLTTLPLPTFAAGVTASTTHTLVGATPVSGGYVNISVCASAADSVSLPASPRVGQEVFVSNAGAAAAAVYPGEAATKIDGGSAGASVTLTNAKSALFTYTGATLGWQSVGMATRSA